MSISSMDSLWLWFKWLEHYGVNYYSHLLSIPHGFQWENKPVIMYFTSRALCYMAIIQLFIVYKMRTYSAVKLEVIWVEIRRDRVLVDSFFMVTKSRF